MQNKRKPNGRKYSSKRDDTNKFSRSRSKADTKIKEDDGTRSQSPNDWSWYVRSPQLVKDVASISYNNALGAGFTLNEDQTLNSGYVVGKSLKMPGIIGIHTVPTPGFSNNPASPINIAAKNFYVWIRHQNSGHANYDSPDLMMYLIAMDSVYAWIQHCMRMYGIARVYSQRNRYIGDALLRLCGVNPTDLRSNLANFRAAVNMLIVKASAFCTPNTMTLYNRHMWMYSGVYKDADIDKAQMYMYLPSIMYKYNETAEGGGRCDPVLELVQASTTQISRPNEKLASWFINEGNNMLAALQGSEDINIMSGDILKAYGREGCNTLAFLPEDYAVVPIYSEEILDQIHNTTCIGAFLRKSDTFTAQNEANTLDYSCLAITQDNTDTLDPYLVIKPSVINGAQLSLSKIVDMGENDPTPERTIVATRNMVSGATLPEDGGTQTSPQVVLHTRINNFGSDLCLFLTMIQDPITYAGTNYYTGNTSQAIDENTIKFSKFPIGYRGNINTDGKFELYGISGDINNFTVISNSDLREMHESAILSQFGVPI